jgi:hypothetical protein
MVYIDNYNCRGVRGMIFCHMMADTLDELFKMADLIGINRKYYQNNPRHPHFDICKSKKKLAILNGAIEVTTKQLIEHFKQR